MLVIGWGASGSSAAIAAADAGASVLIVEKAPLGEEGGNSRVCGQMFAWGHDDVEETTSYFRNLYGELEVPEEVLSVYAEGVACSADTYAELFGLDKADFHSADTEGGYASLEFMSPEYPEFVTNEETALSLMMLHDGHNDSYMWQNYRQQVVNRADSVDVWLETPAIALIQEPSTKTILGATVERDGEQLNIRALNGIILTCGGFENNRTMLEDYLGLGSSAPVGGTYNTGDGHAMAKAVGADMWHMHAWEGGFTFGGLCYPTEDGNRGKSASAPSGSGAYFLVGGDGYRFLNEAEALRHGHNYNNGTWDNPRYPSKIWCVFDDTNSSYLTTLDTYEVEYVQADTLTELAELAGFKEGVLEQTVSDFNFFAESGYEYAFQRSASSMQALGDGPYYASPYVVYMLNTQGGPRRNENAEILDVDGDPIPHLYGAGECGGICANMYQGGGNMAECLIFGQIAGKNAAVEKDALEASVIEAVESDLVYTIGVQNDVLEESTVEDYSTDLADNEYVVSVPGMGGDIIVKVTTDGETVLDLEVLEEHETENLGHAAIEVLVPAIIEAGTTEGIDAISGSTVTSNALFEAVAEALAQAQAE